MKRLQYSERNVKCANCEKANCQPRRWGGSKDRVWAAGWGKKGSDTSFQLVRTGASGLTNELRKESGPWMLLVDM